jgi:hypothetical protein
MFSLVPRLSGVVVLQAVMVVMLAAVVGLGVVLIAQRPAWACSCAPISLTNAFARADAVFIGKVEAEEPQVQTAVSTVKVNGVYKGDLPPRTKIFSGPPCGVGLSQGSGPLVIFAHAATDQARELGAQYWAHLCGGTGQFTAEDIERAALGKPVPVRPPESHSSGHGWDGLVIPLLVGLGVLGVVITVIAGRVKLHR